MKAESSPADWVVDGGYAVARGRNGDSDSAGDLVGGAIEGAWKVPLGRACRGKGGGS